MAGNRYDDDLDREIPDLENPENRHEHRDVNERAVGKFGIALALLCVVALALLFGLFRYFLSVEQAKNPIPRTIIPTDARKRPPEPQLEETPVLDLERMRQAEDQALNSYGWVDGQNGIVRIPIDRAIDLLAQRGLPNRKQPATQSTAPGVSMPAESGLGPIVQQEGGPLANELRGAQPTPAEPGGAQRAPNRENR
jgi:hypothetical protein